MTQFLVFVRIIVLIHKLFTITQSYVLPTHEEFMNENNKLDWNSAETHCLSTYNSHLLSIHDTNTFEELRTTISAIKQAGHHFWLGLVNIATNDTNIINYKWSDSTEFNFGNDLHPGTFPWFDERPEIPSKDRYVRLWGGSASLLWDDTNENNKYFWICNSNDTLIKNKIIETNNNIESTNNNMRLETFWKFALIGMLTLAFCILVLRVRTVYKNCKTKHKMSSLDLNRHNSTQITDFSFLESSNKQSRTNNIPALHFSEVDQRDDSLEFIDDCNDRILSPYSHSNVESIPQIPMNNSGNNYINLQIEHDINTIHSMEELFNCNMSMAATFDASTMVEPLDDEYSHSMTFSDNDTLHHNRLNSVISNNTQSYHSTMAAFDVTSFKMKADEFKFEMLGENLRCLGNKLIDISDTTNYVLNENIGKDEFIVSGETSDDCHSEILIQQNENQNENENEKETHDINKQKSQLIILSEKEIEIKANISQIMKNLKRMKTMSISKNDE